MPDLVLFQEGYDVSELNRINLAIDDADDNQESRLGSAQGRHELSNNLFSAIFGGLGPSGAMASSAFRQFTTGWLNDRIAQINYDSEQDRRSAIESMGIYAQQITGRDREAFTSYLQNPSLAEYNIMGIRDTVSYLRQNSNLRDEIRIPLIQELAINAQRDIDQLRLQIPEMVRALNDQINQGTGTGLNNADITRLRDHLNQVGSDVAQVSSRLRTLEQTTNEQGVVIGTLQSQMGDVESALRQLGSQLSDQNARLTDVEQVADLVINQLSRVSTHGLEAYDRQIASLQDAHLSTLGSSTATTTDRLMSAARLNQAVELRMQEVRRVEGQLNTFFAVTNMVGQLGQFVGSTEIQQIAQIASAAAQIGVGIAALAGVGGTALSYIAGGATLGPPGMIAGGVMALFSAFSSSQGSNGGMSAALRNISEQLAALQRQIAELGTYIGQRFDRVENLLLDQNRLIMLNFRQTIELLNTLQRTMMQEFLTTQGRIDALERIGLQIVSELTDVRNTMAQGFSTLYSQDYQRILTQIVGYYDNQHYDQVPRLSETAVRQAMLSMIAWGGGTGDGVKNPIFHGDGAGNYALSQILNIPVGEAAQHANFLLGILRAQGMVFVPQALPSNLTQPIHNQTCSIPNLGTRVIDPFAFTSVVGSIFKLIDRVPEYAPQRQDRCQLETLRLLAQQYLEVTLAAKTDARPIHYFLNLYQNQINALIQFVYKTIVDTLDVRGEDVHAEALRLQASLPALESTSRAVASQLDRLETPLNIIRNTISDSCYSCSDGQSPGIYGLGYCTDPNFAQNFALLRNGGGSTPPYNYMCLNPSRDLNDVRSNGATIPGPAPLLPTSNCHNAINIQRTVALHQGVSDRAAHVYPATANDIATLSQRLPNYIEWDGSQEQLTISPAVLSSLSSFTNLLNQLPNTPLDDLPANDFFNTFTQLTTCQRYIRWACCDYANGRYVFRNDIEGGPNQLQTITGNIATAQPMLAPINHAGLSLNDTRTASLSAVNDLMDKIRKAQELNVSSLYYLETPNAQQLNAMLQTTINWFTSGSSASERARIIQVLLTSISNREQLYQILEGLNIAKRGLALFLEFAFAEEYQNDMASQLIVRMMLNGTDILSSLNRYNPNNHSAPPILQAILNQITPINQSISVVNITTRQTGGTINITMQDVARPNASAQTYTVNATEDIVISNITTQRPYVFTNGSLEYFDRQIAVGLNATLIGTLMPAYRWLVSLINQIVTYRDYVFPTGLSLRDFSPTRILSAIRTNESQILNLLSSPLLNLTDTRDTSGNTAYLLAANACDANAVNRLFALGANVNLVNGIGDSAANGASQCAYFANRINLLMMLISQNITICRSTDTLYNALLEVRQAHPTTPLQQLGCIQLPPAGPTTTPGPTQSTATSPTNTFSPTDTLTTGSNEGTQAITSTTPAPTANETSDSENASDDTSSDSTLYGVIAFFVIFAAVACCVMAYQQGQIAGRNNARGNGRRDGDGPAGPPPQPPQRPQERIAINDGFFPINNRLKTGGQEYMDTAPDPDPAHYYPQDDWHSPTLPQHETMLLTLLGIMAASHLAEEATLLKAVREASPFEETIESSHFEQQEESTEAPHFENQDERTWRHRNDPLKTLYREHLPPHTHVAEYLVIRHSVNDTLAQLVMQPFSDIVGNLMLLQVIIHLIASCFFTTENEAPAPTVWVDRDKANTRLLQKMQRSITFNQSKLATLKTKHPAHDFSWADFCLDEQQCHLNELNQTTMLDAGALNALRADMRCFKQEMQDNLSMIANHQIPCVVESHAPSLVTTHGLFVETSRSLPACVDWTEGQQMLPAH